MLKLTLETQDSKELEFYLPYDHQKINLETIKDMFSRIEQYSLAVAEELAVHAIAIYPSLKKHQATLTSEYTKETRHHLSETAKHMEANITDQDYAGQPYVPGEN